MDVSTVLKVLTFLSFQPSMLGYRKLCNSDIPKWWAEGCSGQKLCPHRIPHGALSSLCSPVVGSVCEYYCNSGFEKNKDVFFISCLPSSVWDFNIYTLCTNRLPMTTTGARLCPENIPNGLISTNCDRRINSRCRFTCEIGCEATVHSLDCIDQYYKLDWTPRRSACLCLTTDTPIASRSRNSYLIIVVSFIGVLVIVVILTVIGLLFQKRRSAALLNSVTTVTVHSPRMVPRNLAAPTFTHQVSHSPNATTSISLLYYNRTDQRPRFHPNVLSCGPLVKNIKPYDGPPPSYGQVVNNPTGFKS